MTKQGCAFVQYTRRASAEVAAEKTFNKLVGKFCVIFPSGLQPLGQHQNSLWAENTNDPSSMGCNNIPLLSPKLVKGRRLTIRWGRSQGQKNPIAADGGSAAAAAAPGTVTVPGLPPTLPKAAEELTNNFFNIGGASGAGPSTSGAAPAAAAVAAVVAANPYLSSTATRVPGQVMISLIDISGIC